MNGCFLAADAHAISAKDRGFLLGDGIFTTLRYAATQLQFFEQHYRRLATAAKRFRLSFQYSVDALETICHQLVEINQLQASTAALRITLSRGAGGRGLVIPDNRPATTLLVSVNQYQAATRPLRLSVSEIRRHSTSLTAHYKTLNYLDAIMARDAAINSGFDDAIFLNENNACVCTTAANIFIVEQEAVMTPALQQGVLNGVMRGEIIRQCQQLGFKLLETELPLERIMRADEVFISNSLMGVQPISHIKQQAFLTGEKSVGQLIKDSLELTTIR